jgi:CheY-like chemotaxis protein
MPIRDIRSAQSYRQTILIVDDQPTVLAIHEAVIKSAVPHARIVCMTDAAAALNWLNHKHVDLIITDYRMQKMDGMHFVNALRGSSLVSRQPILVITALDDEKIHQQLLSAGVTACLCKPAHTSRLGLLARNLLTQSKLNYTGKEYGNRQG